MPAAWNARRAIRLTDRPTLIVGDMFGDGPLSSHIDATYNSGALQNLTGANEHADTGVRIVQEARARTGHATRLWLMDADGSDVTQFTAPIGPNAGTTVQDEHPSWSPDGTTIAFARSHQNGSRFVMTKQRPEDFAVAMTPQPTDDTDHTFDLPDWQPLPVEP